MLKSIIIIQRETGEERQEMLAAFCKKGQMYSLWAGLHLSILVRFCLGKHGFSVVQDGSQWICGALNCLTFFSKRALRKTTCHMAFKGHLVELQDVLHSHNGQYS